MKMYATIRNNYYIKVTKRPRDYYTFNAYYHRMKFFRRRSFRAHTGASLTLRNAYFSRSIFVSTSLKTTFISTCLHTVCRAHHRLASNRSQILIAYIIRLIRLSSGHLAKSSSNKKKFVINLYDAFRSTLNLCYIGTTVTQKVKSYKKVCKILIMMLIGC